MAQIKEQNRMQMRQIYTDKLQKKGCRVKVASVKILRCGGVPFALKPVVRELLITEPEYVFIIPVPNDGKACFFLNESAEFLRTGTIGVITGRSRTVAAPGKRQITITKRIIACTPHREKTLNRRRTGCRPPIP